MAVEPDRTAAAGSGDCGEGDADSRRVPGRRGREPHNASDEGSEEDGEWKAFHSHASLGVPNAQMLDPIHSLRRRKLPVAAISRV
jgi:hypothetical protein